MKTASAFILLLGLVSGCASVTPNYDTRFGEAVRAARLKMTINPQAGLNPDQVLGLDGRAARDSMQVYHESFKSPPPVVNVINIGGTTSGVSGR